jgi:hypothetical protein
MDFLFNCARHAFHQHRMLRIASRCLRGGYPRGAFGMTVTFFDVDRDIFFPHPLPEQRCFDIPRGEAWLLKGIHLWVLLQPLLAARAVFDAQAPGPPQMSHPPRAPRPPRAPIVQTGPAS